MRVLSITPPMTQLNTPYPATAYLTGYLRKNLNIECYQRDFSIELALQLFSKAGLAALKKESQKKAKDNAGLAFFIEAFDDYTSTVDLAVKFLQGKDPSLSTRISQRNLFPEGPRFAQALDQVDLNYYFGTLGTQDQAKYLASLFIDDLADYFRDAIDDKFTLSRYGEKLAASQPDFAVIEKALQTKTYIDQTIETLTERAIKQTAPDLILITVPFPGNLFAALRIASLTKQINSNIKIAIGGGYPNTELRQLSDPGIFKYVDYITLDDGEIPIRNLIRYLQGTLEKQKLTRTYLLEEGKVRYLNDSASSSISQNEIGFPTYDGLDLQSYLSVIEMLNPMHRLWSDARWNKLTIAHGCYWKKCSFCDTSLDYISRYEPSHPKKIVDQMESLIKETGNTGFHFVDEAAPPAVIKAICQEIIRRNLKVSWWGNIRFEKTFTKELTQLMADSGCIAVTGGLEVASDRLLKLINKGVTIEQVTRVTRAFQSAGILVHAYLMYGFPTQTIQETIDSLEVVRQLFKSNCIQSAYWHRFSATIHSPIGKEPKNFGIKVNSATSNFANNDLDYSEPANPNSKFYRELGQGLHKALYNYMHGVGLEEDVDKWFSLPVKIPKTTIQKNQIRNYL
ncbi:MAG: radical SAM protein [Bacteriovoracia bacterium]